MHPALYLMTGTAPAVGASTPKATSLAVNIDVAHGDDIQNQNQNTNLAAASGAIFESARLIEIFWFRWWKEHTVT